MDKVFRRIISSDFAELRGTTVEALIPVPQHLINELIAAALRGNRNISSVTASIRPQNRVSLDVKTRLLPWPLNLKLKLDDSVDLASYSSPKMRAWMENNRLLGSLGSMFNALPDEIKLYGNQVVIDLGAFLHTAEQKKLLKLLKSVGVRTEAGKMILEARIEVME
jgi:hypothetical protein